MLWMYNVFGSQVRYFYPWLKTHANSKKATTHDLGVRLTYIRLELFICSAIRIHALEWQVENLGKSIRLKSPAAKAASHLSSAV